MLPAVRVVLEAYTASFRVPSFVGHQLTLPVPPLSTIYGLLGAARGAWVDPEEVAWLAYRLEYGAKASDLETIVTVERPHPRDIPRPVQRNVLQREFLVHPVLELYLPIEWEEALRRPRYALLLGRTQDLAYAASIRRVELTNVPEGEVRGVLLPHELVLDRRNRVSAWLQNLPVAFTADREVRGVHIFGVVDSQADAAYVASPGWLVRDEAHGATLPLYRREWITRLLAA